MEKLLDNYPNFFIIGGQKCGTSAACANLNQHPEIFMITNKNKPDMGDGFPLAELHIFNDEERYARGIDFCLDHFKECGNARIVGEKTPDYLYHEKVSHRIKHSFPNSRFLVMLRDPVTRAFSAWNHIQDQKGGWFGKDAVGVPFEKVLNENLEPSILKWGKYVQYIRPWLKVFPKWMFKFVVMEDILKDMSGEYNKIFEWLAVQPFEYKFQNLHSRHYTETLKEDTRIALAKYYKPWNKQLFKEIGYDIPAWN
tara:strand:- start:4415 stop:5176 length:762 start_codon:yes stop_codon:yes gene_type:complete